MADIVYTRHLCYAL